MASFGSEDALAARARGWRVAALAAVCDVVRPWSHGVVARATRYPRYYDFNVVCVQKWPVLGVDELSAFADQALAGLEHRRLDFDLSEAADPLRRGFEERGWRALRLLWMRHHGDLPLHPRVPVVEVPYDAVRALRIAWLAEDFPDPSGREGVRDPNPFLDQAREVSELCGARVLAVVERGTPVGFAQLERRGSSAEITEVFVHPDHRGRGVGTALTAAAIHHAGDAAHLWIQADDEDRPKHLYARLGFRPVTTMMQFMRTAPST